MSRWPKSREFRSIFLYNRYGSAGKGFAGLILKYLEHEVQRLLARGKFTLRQIARLTGVSRGTVTSIANGTRKIKSQKYQELIPLLPEDEFASGVYSDPPKRCGGCGYIVYKPCRICEARQEAAKGGIKKEDEKFDPDPKRRAR